MLIERYFHIRTGLMTGGATVRVTVDSEAEIGQVDMQVAYCRSPSKKKGEEKGDIFCRKNGREQAIAAPIKVIPLRYLPLELQQVQATVLKRSKRGWAGVGDFNFAMKYFLPKE